MSKSALAKVVRIGLRWWGKKMTAALQKANGDIEIVCAAAPNPARKKFAGRHASPPAKQIIADDPVPAIKIALRRKVPN